jgi:hypothetical protein
MIEAGARRLYEAAQLVRGHIDPALFTRITGIFNAILSTSIEWHQGGKAHALKEQYMNEHSMVTSELTFGT